MKIFTKKGVRKNPLLLLGNGLPSRSLAKQIWWVHESSPSSPLASTRQSSLGASLKRRLVGARGFEPPTSCSQSRRATRLRHAPILAGRISITL